MKNYNKINNIVGWGIFLIATFVYLICTEPTVSWWDCGEFITTSYKLQIGHPPGAPTFQLMNRVFSLLAFGDVTKVALMMNILTGLFSSFAILFLFWSITMLAKKLALRSGELTTSKIIAIMGSGAVGALAYTFSDSHWFSAEETIVWAGSSSLSALVFWLMLKWEAKADEHGSLRFIILICFLIGLAIGIHLLNLLTIPAMTFIYYFKKYKPTRKGIIITSVIAILLVGTVMKVIIPWIVKLANYFELFFVNSIGLPFNSGTIIYFLLLVGGIVWGLHYTRKHQRVIANVIILCLTFLLIGYSSFVMLVIRSHANPPINENNPGDAVSLLSYLNREQYGDWPLLYGPYYNAPVVSYEDGNPIYQKDSASGKYIIVDDRKSSVPVYDPRFMTIFPRMWSNQQSSHIRAYKEWGKIQGDPISVTKPGSDETETIIKPTFGENLRFFFTYQLGHMYFRYFMWNFVGRQNDVEGHGGIEHGNWLSGIPFIDEARLGSQSNLPESMKNPARNTFYFLPLILGLIGLFFQMNKRYQDGIIVAWLFVMMGLAIVTYLNQYPYQPRERDYSYVGSFYAFSIWIGLGIMALWEWLSKKLNPSLAAGLITLVCLLLVPGIMAKEGWNDHDRSHKYACRDFAANYLNSCAPNAILITNGDNDTFSLWYCQNVEGIRTDVRIINYVLASGEWYVQSLYRKSYDSDPLPMTLKMSKYGKGINEYLPYYDQGLQGEFDVKDIIRFINSDDEQSKIPLQTGRRISFIPVKNMRLMVDTAKVVKNGLVPAKLAGKIVPAIHFKLNKNYIFKNDLMLLDFLSSNNWDRPLYFTSPAALENFDGLEKFCHVEGMCYKFMPVVAENYYEGMGGMTYDEATYDILMNKCKWGNLADPRVYVDRESYRNSMIPRNNFLRLAQLLIDENKKDSAVKVLDRCQEVFPNEKITYDMYMLPFAEVYYAAGAIDKANKMVDILTRVHEENIDYYSRLSPKFAASYDTDKQRAIAVLERLSQVAKQYKQDPVANKIETYLKTKNLSLSPKARQ